jgi:hypothetical protein
MPAGRGVANALHASIAINGKVREGPSRLSVCCLEEVLGIISVGTRLKLNQQVVCSYHVYSLPQNHRSQYRA